MATDGEEVDIDALRQSGLAVELIPGRLYFASFGCHPPSSATTTFFTADFHLHYSPYFADFGPLDISNVVRFAKTADDHLRDQRKTVVFYSSHAVHHRANAACLVACYCVASLKMTVAAVCAAFRQMYPPLLPFRDAAFGVSTYNITLQDVIAGLAKAIDFGWFDVSAFDVESYSKHDAVENGDFNIVVPGKVVAFSSPVEGLREVKTVVKDFRHYGVKLIVRLNEPLYDRRDFLKYGFDHLDIIFADGGVPSDLDMRTFHEALTKTHKSGGAVAVHCKAGLGRTGTMIASWMMREHGFTSKEAIGWCRLCRPGSVMGDQQCFLERLENRLIRQENQSRPKPQLAPVIQFQRLVPRAAGNAIRHAKNKRRETLDATELRYAQQEAEISLISEAFVPQNTVAARFKYATSKALVVATVADAVEKQTLQMSLQSRSHSPAMMRSVSATSPAPSSSAVAALVASGGRSVSQLSMNFRSGSPALTIGSVDDVLPCVVLNASRSPPRKAVDPGWATATVRPVHYYLPAS